MPAWWLQLGILANFGLIAAGAFTRYVNEVLAKNNEVLSLQVRHE
jgi:membrane protein implicated in regulation of membrane protease activity